MISAEIKKKLSGGSAIRAMFEKGNELKKLYGADNVFDFTLGNPDVAAPDAVNAAIVKRVTSGAENLHGYMSNAGFPDVCKAIAKKESRDLDFDIRQDGVVMTVGAAGALNVVLKSILNPGDEVLVQAPYFLEYGSYVSNYGATLVAVPANTATFQLDAEKIGTYVTEKTKAVIINSPNNPTGVIYSKETLEALNSVLKRKEKQYGSDIYIISDEPYREIVYGDAKVTPVMSVFDNAVLVYSYSKSLSLAGERIGYLAISPKCADYENLAAACVFCNRVMGFVNASNLFQWILPEVMDCAADVSKYEKRRDMLLTPLTEMGYECVKPDGAFYLFMKVPTESEDVFVNDYCLKHNILVVGGKGFGCPGYVRIAYCVPEKSIIGALPHFKEIAEELKLKK